MLKKFLSFFLGSIGSLMIGLLSIPIITRLLSPEDYGIASLFMTIGTLLATIAIVGTDQSFIRFFINHNRIKLLKKCLILSSFTTLFLIIVIIFLKESLSKFLSFNENLIITISLYIILTILYRFSTLILRMLQYGLKFSLIQVLQRVLELVIFLIIYFISDSSFLSLIYSWIISLLILIVVSNLMIISFWEKGIDKNEEPTINDILKFSIPFAISSIIIISFQSLDKLFLGEWTTNKELGQYMAAFKIVGIINVLQSAFSTFWTPISLEAFHKNSDDKSTFEKISKFTLIVMYIIGTSIVLFKDIILYLLGSEYRSVGSLLPLLVMMPIMYTLSETTVQGVNFSKKSQYHIVISIFVLLVNLISLIVLIPKLGIKGAALSIAISYIVFYIIRTYFGMKNYKFNYSKGKVIVLTTLFFSWSILIMIFNSQMVVYFGGLSIYIVIYLLFKSEILDFFRFTKKYLGDKI